MPCQRPPLVPLQSLRQSRPHPNVAKAHATGSEIRSVFDLCARSAASRVQVAVSTLSLRWLPISERGNNHRCLRRHLPPSFTIPLPHDHFLLGRSSRLRLRTWTPPSSSCAQWRLPHGRPTLLMHRSLQTKPRKRLIIRQPLQLPSVTLHHATTLVSLPQTLPPPRGLPSCILPLVF
jgi:hypothetical protein